MIYSGRRSFISIMRIKNCWKIIFASQIFPIMKIISKVVGHIRRILHGRSGMKWDSVFDQVWKREDWSKIDTIFKEGRLIQHVWRLIQHVWKLRRLITLWLILILFSRTVNHIMTNPHPFLEDANKLG